MVGNTNTTGVKSTQLTVTSSGNFSSVGIYAYRDSAFVTIGGYFTNATAKTGTVATVSGINVLNASNLSTPCQCDDGSVKWISFANSGSNLTISIAHTLTANNYVRFLCTLPLA